MSHSHPPIGEVLAAALDFRFQASIAEIDADVWNALATSSVGASSPFMRHEFLLALELTGCVCAATGWQPHHLVVSQSGSVVAVMPLYIKNNSYGEYVFDWSWADAYRQHGMRYYPKLVTSVPFTPSTGPRLLLAPGSDAQAMTRAVAATVIAEATRMSASSWHLLFPAEEESARFTAAGLRPRIACQYHWHNRGYGSFDEFLATFSSRKRKNLRKERQAVFSAGVQFTRLHGHAITTELWKQFYRFYQNTYHVRGQQGYLSLEFFMTLARVMPDNLLLVVASHAGRPIAAALSLQDEQTLYGRYWGSLEEYQFLHFETCYYQGIEYAIENGLQKFDSGAQGEHKIQRGFEPVFTYSNHWIADVAFDQAIADFLHKEAGYVREHRGAAAEYLPFRQE